MLMVMVMPLYPSILRNQERSKWPTRLVRLFCQGVLLVLIVKNNWVSLFCQGVSDLIGYFSATERERSADSFERLVCPRMRKRTLYVMKNIGREWWVWGRTYTRQLEMCCLCLGCGRERPTRRSYQKSFKLERNPFKTNKNLMKPFQYF